MMCKSDTDREIAIEQEFLSLVQLLNSTANDASISLKILKKELSEFDSRHGNHFNDTATKYMRSDMRTAKDTASSLKNVAHKINKKKHKPSRSHVDAARRTMEATAKSMAILKTTAQNYDRKNGKSTGVKGAVKNAFGANNYDHENNQGQFGNNNQDDRHDGVAGMGNNNQVDHNDGVTGMGNNDRHGHGTHGGGIGGDSDTVESIVKSVLRDNFDISPLSHQINAAENSLTPSFVGKAKQKIHHVKDKMTGTKHSPTNEGYYAANEERGNQYSPTHEGHYASNEVRRNEQNPTYEGPNATNEVGVRGSVFSVEILANKLVGHLKTEIKKECPKTLTGDAKNLRLFLAMKGSNWLASNDPAGISMRSGDVPAQVKELLRDEIDPADEIGDVHALVVVPDGTVGSASEAPTLAQIAQKVDKLYERTKRTTRKYTPSNLHSSNGSEFLDDLNARVDSVRTASLPGGSFTEVEGYPWQLKTEGEEKIYLNDESQREEYRQYVMKNIGDVLDANRLCVEDVANKGNFLAVSVPGRDIELFGRTNLLILNTIAKPDSFVFVNLPDVRMLFEVKRNVERASVYQALSELIALDLITENPKFFWISEKINDTTQICKATIDNSGEAFEVIRKLLAQSPTDDTEFRFPCIERPVKRQKLSTSIGEAGEGGGILESIQQYYGIASILGPDVEMAREVAKLVVRSIPAFSCYN